MHWTVYFRKPDTGDPIENIFYSPSQRSDESQP